MFRRIVFEAAKVYDIDAAPDFHQGSRKTCGFAGIRSSNEAYKKYPRFCVGILSTA